MTLIIILIRYYLYTRNIIEKQTIMNYALYDLNPPPPPAAFPTDIHFAALYISILRYIYIHIVPFR